MSTLILDFRGLMILVLGKERTSVICIDVRADRSGGHHPTHVPTLETDRFTIRPASSTPSVAYAPFKAAWSLDQCAMQVYPAGKPPVAHVRPEMVLTKPADKTSPPATLAGWDGTEWVAQFGKVLPGLKLRPDWPTAPVVQARIDLSGGQLRSMQPEGQMENAVWSFGHAAQQIFTTRFEYRLEGDDNDGFEFRLTGKSEDRTIYIRPRPLLLGNVLASIYHLPMIEEEEGASAGHHGGHAVAHAAPAAGTGGPAEKLPDIVHTSACYELFADPPAERPVPTFVKFAGDRPVGETAGCIPAAFRE